MSLVSLISLMSLVDVRAGKPALRRNVLVRDVKGLLNSLILMNLLSLMNSLNLMNSFNLILRGGYS